MKKHIDCILTRCPFCGTKRAKTIEWQDEFSNHKAEIKCDCGARSAECFGKQALGLAINHWNTRTNESK